MPIYDRLGGVMKSGQPLIDVPQVETAALRAASPYYLNQLGSRLIPGCTAATEQPWAPGCVFPIPTTSAEAVALGWPSIAGAVDGDLWLCDEAAGNLVGEINGYQLAPQNTPLQNRDFQGLPYGGNLWAKKAVEFTATTTQRFDTAAAATLDVTVEDFSVSFLVRLPSAWVDPGGGAQRFIGKRDAGTGWTVYNTSATAWALILNDGVGTTHNFVLAASPYDGALHLFTFSVDRNGNVSLYLDDVATANVVAGSPGSLTTGSLFHLGSVGAANIAPAGQVAWVYHCIGVAASRTGHDAMWARLSSAGLGTPNTYTRANPLVVPISASRVACYADNQLAVGYSAGFLTDGNAQRTGIVAEDGATFEAIGSTDFPANSAVTPFNTITTVDGPSGMRDARRATQGGAYNPFVANICQTPLGAGWVIAGATNVSWLVGAWYKRGNVATNARINWAVAGDPGGAEIFTVLNTAAAPVDWAQIQLACAVTRPAHTAAQFCFGGNALNDDADFAEFFAVRNRATASLAWRRVGTAAAAATSTPRLSFSNIASPGQRYAPTRGTLEFVVSGFQLTNNALFVLCGGAVGAAGSLLARYVAGQLTVYVYDNTPALAATVLCGAMDATEWRIRISWDHAYPIPGAGGAYVIVERINPGASPTVLGTWMGPGWTVPAAGIDPNVTPVYVGSRAGIDSAARCFISLA